MGRATRRSRSASCDLTSRIAEANILEMARNADAWKNTVNAPENAGQMACLIQGAPQGTPCCVLNGNGTSCIAPFPPAEISIRSSDNAVYNPIAPANGSPSPGFDETGAPCGNFSTAKPTLYCPIRIHVLWQPVCENPTLDPTCVGPRISLTFRFDTTILPFRMDLIPQVEELL